MPDHNEAMRLADEVRTVADRLQYTPGGFYGVETVGPLNQAAALLRQQAERIAELESEVLEQARCNGMGAERELALMAERDQHQATATALIALLADIRKACGDNGKRMQPELVEFIGSMKAERDQLRAEVERLRVDADRYVGLKTRHAYLMVVRLIGNNGFSSDKAGALIDEYADAARAEVAAFNALTDEQRRQRLQDELDAARTTHKETE